MPVSLPSTHRSPEPGRRTDPDSLRRRLCLGGAALLGLGGCAVGAPPPSRPSAEAGVVPFSSTRRTGPEIDGWHEHIMRRDLPTTRYQAVDDEGRTVAHAVADRSTSGLRCDVDIDPQATRWLEWQWKVNELPEQATVSVDHLDDSPARVVVAFDGDLAALSLRDLIFQEQVQLFTGHALPFATLMYVWDAQAPIGSVFQYWRSGRIRYLVVESGPGNTGRWMKYRRDVVADYRHVFGGDPGRIRSVGVLTDSDDLKLRSEAWFGDLVFR